MRKLIQSALVVGLASMPPLTHAGPYWVWENGDFRMFAGDLLFSSTDSKGSNPATRSIHKVHISKGDRELKDAEAQCFVHFYREQPVLMYCERGRSSELSGGVWRREGGQHFQCVSGCSSRVPKRFGAALDG
jgi:hypothetical protein